MLYNYSYSFIKRNLLSLVFWNYIIYLYIPIFPCDNVLWSFKIKSYFIFRLFLNIVLIFTLATTHTHTHTHTHTYIYIYIYISFVRASFRYKNPKRQSIQRMLIEYYVIRVLQIYYQSFGDSTEYTNNNRYYSHFMFHYFFHFFCKINVLIFVFAYFQFNSGVSRNSKVNYLASSLFCGGGGSVP